MVNVPVFLTLSCPRQAKDDENIRAFARAGAHQRVHWKRVKHWPRGAGGYGPGIAYVESVACLMHQAVICSDMGSALYLGASTDADKY